MPFVENLGWIQTSGSARSIDRAENGCSPRDSHWASLLRRLWPKSHKGRLSLRFSLKKSKFYILENVRHLAYHGSSGLWFMGEPKFRRMLDTVISKHAALIQLLLLANNLIHNLCGRAS